MPGFITRDGMATKLIAELVTARQIADEIKDGQRPESDRRVYLKQADLMAAIGVTKEHTFNDIVTRAALKVPSQLKGWALVHNSFHGYRIADRAEVRDLRVQLRKLRTARTILMRVATVLLAGANSPMIQMIGESLGGIVNSIEIAIRALDREIK